MVEFIVSWTDIYPFLNDDLVVAFVERATVEEMGGLDRAFRVAKRLNCRKGDHLVVTSLTKRPEKIDNSADEREAALFGGQWFGHFEFKSLLDCANKLRRRRPEIVWRVYLAAEHEDLVGRLTQAGCEVFLMEASGDLEHAEAMWKFLALEEERWITFTDPSFGREMMFDILRTEQVKATNLGCWRSPFVLGEEGERLKASAYRPIDPGHFGVKGGYPAGQLMKALIWHCQKEAIETRCIEGDGLHGSPIEGSEWPSRGFDSWFLLSAIYPRVAFSGVLTLLIWQRKALSPWYMFDAEYVTWANGASQLMMTRKAVTERSPWTGLPEDGGIAIRPDTQVIRRERRRIYEGCELPELDEKVASFFPFEGSLTSLLEWSRDHVDQKWWIDFGSLLAAGKSGVELFLDRRYDEADVVVSGFCFRKVTAAIAEWAQREGLSAERWSEGMIRKVPKLEGPMVLWRTEFSRRFAEALLRDGTGVDPEVLLAGWVEQDKAIMMSTTAGRMGWVVRF